MVEPPLLERERDYGSGTVRRGRGPPKTEAPMEKESAHSGSVKMEMESVDPAMLLPNSNSAPPGPGGVCVSDSDSGCGNLDLPPSPPPLPLLSESTVPPTPSHTHDHVLSMQMGPPGCQITDQPPPPPLKKSRITVPMSPSPRKLVSQETTSAYTMPCQRCTDEPRPSQLDQQPPPDPQRVLYLPKSAHRSSTITTHENACLRFRAHKLVIAYDTRMEGRLKALRLYHITRMGRFNLDTHLLTALMERWRPETHTFHLPVGEMTVTLEDVACLWGLPITGQPMTGYLEGDWGDLIMHDLGLDPSNGAFRVNTKSYMQMSWLRGHFSKPLHSDAEDVVIDRYTRAYVMDLFGSLMFPDSSGGSIPCMYLQLLRDLECPVQYNWGAAVLACLYRALDKACRSGVMDAAGPFMLLQMWSWSRFSVCQPYSRGDPFEDWGTPNLQSCVPFGRFWTTNKINRNNSLGPRTSFARQELDKLQQHLVVWDPYKHLLDKLPSLVQADQDVWRARVPLIHFWTVSWHYPDRVMRQFKLMQCIPPPAPQPWEEHERLFRIDMQSIRRTDWKDYHRNYVAYWDDLDRHIVPSEGVYNTSSWCFYMLWYDRYGMRTVYPDGEYLETIDRLCRTPCLQAIDSISYISHSPGITRHVIRACKDAMVAIKMVVTQGWRTAGKQLLKSCRGHLEDANIAHKLDQLLEQFHLPTDIDAIPDDSPDQLGPAPSIDLSDEQIFAWLLDPTSFSLDQLTGEWPNQDGCFPGSQATVPES